VQPQLPSACQTSCSLLFTQGGAGPHTAAEDSTQRRLLCYPAAALDVACQMGTCSQGESTMVSSSPKQMLCRDAPAVAVERVAELLDWLAALII
jgi:hypothetical protein